MTRAMVQTATPQWVLDSVRTTVREAVASIADAANMNWPPGYRDKIQDPAFMSALVAKTVQCAMQQGHHFDVGALRSFNAIALPDHAPDHALVIAIRFDDKEATTNVEIIYDVSRSIADIQARAEVVTPERWGPGPWVGEPNEVSWHHSGFNCFMRRNLQSGHWNAYVGIPEGHPWFRLKPNRISPRPPTHREIDFAGIITDDPPGLWWIGFSATNPTDLMPWHAGSPELMNNRHFRYPKLQYMREQTELLAACAHVAAVRHRGTHG